MTRDDVFPSKYLRAADLQGRSHILTISDAPYEKLKGIDGKETHKTVLSFKGAEKTLPLNITNWDAVAEATGCPDTNDWPGQQIELYPTRTTMGGKTVDCIRIRKPNRQAEHPRRMSATGPHQNINGGSLIPSNYADRGSFKSGSLHAPVQPPGQPDVDELPEGDEIPF